MAYRAGTPGSQLVSVASERMFDQTFINGRRETKKPYAIILSLLLQIAAICILIAIPLIYVRPCPVLSSRARLWRLRLRPLRLETPLL